MFCRLVSPFFTALPVCSLEGVRAASILCDELPPIVAHSLYAKTIDANHLRQHVISVEDQEYLRKRVLAQKDLVAFIVNGAVLPRKSGVEDVPMDKSKAIAFETPESLKVEVKLPSGKSITGMGIRRGITLIVSSRN